MWSEDFKASLKDKIATMDHWLHVFRIIKNITEEDSGATINQDRYSKEQTVSDNLDKLQSVRKRKREHGLVMQLIEYTLGTDFSVKPETGFSLETLAEAIATIDKTLHALINNVKSIHQDHDELETFVKPALTQGEELIKLLAGKVDAKPKYLNAHFDAPSVWSTIVLLSVEIINISNRFHEHMREFNTNVETTASQAAITYAEPNFQQLGERIDKLNTAMGLLNQIIEDLVDEQDDHTEVSSKRPTKRTKQRANDPHHDPSSSSSSDDSDSSDGSHFHSTSRFKNLPTSYDNASRSAAHQTSVPLPKSDSSRLAAIEAEIQSLKALKDGTAVVFLRIRLQIAQRFQ